MPQEKSPARYIGNYITKKLEGRPNYEVSDFMAKAFGIKSGTARCYLTGAKKGSGFVSMAFMERENRYNRQVCLSRLTILLHFLGAGKREKPVRLLRQADPKVVYPPESMWDLRQCKKGYATWRANLQHQAQARTTEETNLPQAIDKKLERLTPLDRQVVERCIDGLLRSYQ